MKEQVEKLIAEKLDTLIALLVAIATKGEEKEGAIRVLANAGFQPKEIAGFLKITPNAVRVALHRMRKTVKKKKVAKSGTKD